MTTWSVNALHELYKLPGFWQILAASRIDFWLHVPYGLLMEYFRPRSRALLLTNANTHLCTQDQKDPNHFSSQYIRSLTVIYTISLLPFFTILLTITNHEVIFLFIPFHSFSRWAFKSKQLLQRLKNLVLQNVRKSMVKQSVHSLWGAMSSLANSDILHLREKMGTVEERILQSVREKNLGRFRFILRTTIV